MFKKWITNLLPNNVNEAIGYIYATSQFIEAIAELLKSLTAHL